MAKRKRKQQEPEEAPEPCPICNQMECVNRIHYRQARWTPEEWAGAQRMVDARMAAGYQLRTTKNGYDGWRDDDPNLESLSAPEANEEATDWRVVRVPYEKDEWDQLVLDMSKVGHI